MYVVRAGRQGDTRYTIARPNNELGVEQLANKTACALHGNQTLGGG